MEETLNPEHEKLAKIQEQSQACGEFLEWLQSEKRVVLQAWSASVGPLYRWKLGVGLTTAETEREPTDRDYLSGRAEANPVYRPEALRPFHYNVTQLLAEYFGIDLKKLEEEKKAMIERQRAAHAATVKKKGGRKRGKKTAHLK